MAADNPYPCPARLVLADMCAMHSWSQHLDDHSRKLLEWAADTIREQASLNVSLTHRNEQLEGDNAHLFHLHFGSQKGGAA